MFQVEVVQVSNDNQVPNCLGIVYRGGRSASTKSPGTYATESTLVCFYDTNRNPKPAYYFTRNILEAGKINTRFLQVTTFTRTKQPQRVHTHRPTQKEKLHANTYVMIGH